MICQYCNKEAIIVTGDIIYPHRKDLMHLNFWLCRPCSAYVGCHGSTEEPLGTLAKDELRELRRKTHQAVDWIWKDGHKKRTETYRWLAKALSISFKDCHIAKFDNNMCLKTIKIADDFLDSLPWPVQILS
jgi:hypothetical protein